MIIGAVHASTDDASANSEPPKMIIIGEANRIKPNVEGRERACTKLYDLRVTAANSSIRPFSTKLEQRGSNTTPNDATTLNTM